MTSPSDTLAPFEAAIDAVISGDEKTLKTLLEQHASLATAHSSKKHSATLLHYVAANGIEAHLQKTPENIISITKMLLDAGANPNKISNIYGGGEGSTPLIGLVSSSHPADAGKMYDLVRLFCEYGNPNGVNNNSLPLITAISFRQRDAIRALADSGAQINHLVKASATGKLDTAKVLFEESPEPYSDSFGQTWDTPQIIREHALTVAAMTGHLNVVQYLVEQGVDVNAKASSSGDSALIEATNGRYYTIMRYLLDNGADAAHLPETSDDDEIRQIIAQYS